MRHRTDTILNNQNNQWCVNTQTATELVALCLITIGRKFMKSKFLFVLFFVFQFAPTISSAAYIPIAIELVGKVLSSSATSGAIASINFPNSIGDISSTFSGSANTSSTASVSGNADSSAQATASWNFQFKAIRPGIQYFIDWSFSDSVFSRSSGFADGSAETKVNLASLVNILLNDRQYVTVDTFTGSESDSKANAGAGSLNLGYLAVGSIIGFSGDLYSRAVTSSGIFSNASSSASASLNFTVKAVPEPSTVAILLLGMAIMVLLRQRSYTLK